MCVCVRERKRKTSGHLLSHHGQHFQLDTVELVKAGPGASLCQAREHAAQHANVQLVRTVEDQHVLGDGLTQVLDCLRLAGTSGTLRVATAFQLRAKGWGLLSQHLTVR